MRWFVGKEFRVRLDRPSDLQSLKDSKMTGLIWKIKHHCYIDGQHKA